MSILMGVDVTPNAKWLHHIDFNNLGECLKGAHDNIP
jgi:hypothetical protein